MDILTQYKLNLLQLQDRKIPTSCDMWTEEDGFTPDELLQLSILADSIGKYVINGSLVVFPNDGDFSAKGVKTELIVMTEIPLVLVVIAGFKHTVLIDLLSGNLSHYDHLSREQKLSLQISVSSVYTFTHKEVSVEFTEYLCKNFYEFSKSLGLGLLEKRNYDYASCEALTFNKG